LVENQINKFITKNNAIVKIIFKIFCSRPVYLILREKRRFYFMTDISHVYAIFEHLIESLEDARIDPVIIAMINDAREALEENSQIDSDSD
jgi:hypothetical protein|tara:strand:- start:41 stop:313 length:273 start_codon:yes stop_codon:yes gene_type:complete